MYYSRFNASFNIYLQSLYVQSMLLGTEMFYKTDKFNQDISNWDVSNVKDMSMMFDESNYKRNLDKSIWLIVHH